MQQMKCRDAFAAECGLFTKIYMEDSKMVEKKDTKSVHRIIPCPDYDVTGVESWLSYMAEQGYILRDGGVFRGIAAFDRCEPEKVRYRLQPAQKGFVLYDNDGPSDDEVELNGAFGWKYVAKYGVFHIYRADDIDAREMDTDPDVQAMAMNSLHRSQRFNIIWMSIWIIVYLALVFTSQPFLSMVNRGSLISIALVLCVIIFIVTGLVKAVSLYRLRRKILDGDSLGSGTNWRRGARIYTVKAVVGIIAYVAMIVFGCMFILSDGVDRNQMPLSEYQGEVPFQTITDLVSCSDIQNVDNVDDDVNTISKWSDILWPENYKVYEYGDIVYTDGNICHGGLVITYHEAKNEWLANKLYQAYVQRAKQQSDYEKIDMKIAGLDDVDAYWDGSESVIMRKGRRLIVASFYMSGENRHEGDLEEWAGCIAESLE